MKVHRYTPSKVLQPFIKTFMIIESDHGMENRILPDTSIVMAFRLRGMVTFSVEGVRNSLPTSAITGIRKFSRLLDYSAQAATLLVVFNEGGASAFFQEPLHELFEISTSLDNLLTKSQVEIIEDQLAESKSNHNRIQFIEQFLVSKLIHPRGDTLILNAIHKIKSARGDIRVKELLKDLPISRDPFEKRFRRVTGSSPKQFSIILRFRNLITNASKPASLTETAQLAGYFDQAHFIKDFRSFTGQTPTDFFKSSSYW